MTTTFKMEITKHHYRLFIAAFILVITVLCFVSVVRIVFLILSFIMTMYYLFALVKIQREQQ